MKNNGWIAIALACLCMIVSSLGSAQTLAELQQAGKLRIKIRVDPQQDIVARQQVNLFIEVATDKWFTAGTRIGHFEVKDAIALQRETFAVNSTFAEGDTTWTAQLWTLVVYPQRAGVLEIPAIGLRLSIAGDNQSIVGEISTAPLSFVVKTPPQMEDKADWVATNRLEVEENFDKSFDGLKPGDALIRTIRISADNLPAMMLPKVMMRAFDGLGVYAKPPVITDKVNRGDYLAERTESITYVLEKPGAYTLPQLDFYWWDLNSQSLQQESLPARVISTVGIVSSEQIVAGEVLQVKKVAVSKELGRALWLVAGLLLFVALVLWIRDLSTMVASSARGSKKVDALELEYVKNCLAGDYGQAVTAFYQWLPKWVSTLPPDSSAQGIHANSVRRWLRDSNQPDVLQLFDQLMTVAHSPISGAADNVPGLDSLPQRIKRMTKPGQNFAWLNNPVDLRLN